jgi:hypothetical protein
MLTQSPPEVVPAPTTPLTNPAAPWLPKSPRAEVQENARDADLVGAPNPFQQHAALGG